MTNTMTRAQELEALLGFAEENGYTGSTEKLGRVLAQWTAPRDRKPSGPSKVSLENQAKAKEIYDIMPEGEAITNVWVTQNVNGVLRTQKAAVLMGILIRQGLVKKEKEGKVMTYLKL